MDAVYPDNAAATALEAALRPETQIAAGMAANRMPLGMGTLPIDPPSLSAHTLYGPKGVGALSVREGVKLRPFPFGGVLAQEAATLRPISSLRA
jgi:hypothetical protein